MSSLVFHRRPYIFQCSFSPPWVLTDNNVYAQILHLSPNDTPNEPSRRPPPPSLPDPETLHESPGVGPVPLVRVVPSTSPTTSHDDRPVSPPFSVLVSRPLPLLLIGTYRTLLSPAGGGPVLVTSSPPRVVGVTWWKRVCRGLGPLLRNHLLLCYTHCVFDNLWPVYVTVLQFTSQKFPPSTDTLPNLVPRKNFNRTQGIL